ncbi:MAG: hypothetical protein HRT61_14990 [Ekhidna sp.]|nr:hypothetical protein [Ekhidna sp.]
MATTKRKHIDLDEETIRILEHEAVDMGSNFKNYVENLLVMISRHSDYNSSLDPFGTPQKQIELLKKVVK